MGPGAGAGLGLGARVAAVLGWPLVGAIPASSEHALSLPGAAARAPGCAPARKTGRRPPAEHRAAVAVVMTGTR